MEYHALTPKQSRFVDAYTSEVALFNAAKASRVAGYSQKSCRDIGYENLRKASVRAAIDDRLELAFDRHSITFEKVLGGLEIARICAMRDGKYGAAIRALELQGKYLGMFSGRHRSPGLEIDDATEQELVALLCKLPSELRNRLKNALVNECGSE